MTSSLVVAVFACLLVSAPALDPPPRMHQPCWEMLPQPSAYRMANEAVAIVEGTATAKGVVTVTKRFWVGPGQKVADTITVPSLAAMPKTVFVLGLAGPGAGQPIEPDSVLLFLAKNPNGDEWLPLHLYGKAARGVIWFAKEASLGYAQVINPGGYSLTQWQLGNGPRRVVARPKDVRAVVAQGVAARKQWRAVLDIQDKQKRADALLRWIDPATSPDGDAWQERLWPDWLRASDELGEAMVRPLARIVQVGDNAQTVVTAADALSRLGEKARDAVPSLVARLRDLRGVQPIYLVRALKNFADVRAADVLRDYIAHQDPFVAIAAARGLHHAGAPGVAELLEARMPKEIVDRVALSAVAGMLEVIHDLDPLRAERLVEKHFLDDDQLMMQRPWLRQIRDR